MRRATRSMTSHAVTDERRLLPEEFADAVRDALRLMQAPWQLQGHPLTRALVPEQRTDVRSSQTGQTLVRRLTEAIERQRPQEGTAEHARVWRRYRILQLRYLEGHDATEV